MICLKIRTFVVSATTAFYHQKHSFMLWFAWKFVPLWYQQQLNVVSWWSTWRCDLLENSYLCGISNNTWVHRTTCVGLWFAWKFVPLWYQQQLEEFGYFERGCCDLLENSYLCGISNNSGVTTILLQPVVICLKIRTFVVSATTFFSVLDSST